ncbi:MAG: CRISPR-associated helicase Cas3' [Myxococcales bacterium]|nr:CRISPR-associated helicase Cas3' [Myxococcales bacterium]
MRSDDTDGSKLSLSPAEWIAAANDRPEWECWGKGKPRGNIPAHPVLCHMLDVAAVAQLLLTRHAPKALRDRLLAIHPDGEEASLKLLCFVIAIHDLGKFTPAFQAKLEAFAGLLGAQGFDLNAPPTARHHGEAGLGLAREALQDLGLSPQNALHLARAVTAHHGEYPTDSSLNRNPLSGKEKGRNPRWDDARANAIEALRAHFSPRPAPSLAITHAYVTALAGLTSVADWVGSMDEVFVYEPPQASLAEYGSRALERAEIAFERAGYRPVGEVVFRRFTELFPSFAPWPLHSLAEQIADALDEPSLVIVEAPMGEGKTEAALLIANAAAAKLKQHGVFLGLPTKATANQMLGRLQAFLARTQPDEATNLILAHADAPINERFQRLVAVYDREGNGVRAEGWFLSKKRTLLAEHAVGTIDQALLGVMRTQHAFVRLYGLAGKTVVLDEVHAYDTYTSTLLDRLVEWLAALGTTVVLLSATLPSARRRALVEAYRSGLGTPLHEEARAAYPRVTVTNRHTTQALGFAPRGTPTVVSLARLADDLEAVADEVARRVERGGCIGWICNTVDRAQQAYALLGARSPGTPRMLIHARMLPEMRAKRERDLEEQLGPQDRGAQRPERVVVIGTQVLEQSLDVDFDLLVTDLAPVDLLLQRAGRLQRHRDRSNRAPGFEVPQLVVVQPAGDFAHVNIAGVAKVYAERLVRETLRVLEGRSAFTLPDDIEPLVEAVYREDIPVAEDALYGSYIEYFGEAVAKRQDADNRLLPRPSRRADIFGDLRVSFDDDEDPRLHESLRAVTRDAEASVQLVCLVMREGALFVDETDNTPIDLAVNPSRALTARLVRRTVGISRKGLVRELLADASYLPDAWRENALLRHRRVARFERGVATIGDTRLELDPDLGLKLSPVRPRSLP